MDTFSASEPDDTPLKNFRKVRAGLETAGFVDEIERRPDLWLAETRRQTRVKVQRETESVPLRRGLVPYGSTIAFENSEYVEVSPYAAHFPKIMAFISGFAAEVGGQLGRAYIVRLRPQGRVYRHVDHGSYYAHRGRYHIALVSQNAQMTCGNETVVMAEGDIWWFNNKIAHESHNPSDTWRINIIFDLMPAALASKSIRTSS